MLATDKQQKRITLKKRWRRNSKTIYFFRVLKQANSIIIVCGSGGGGDDDEHEHCECIQDSWASTSRQQPRAREKWRHSTDSVVLARATPLKRESSTTERKKKKKKSEEFSLHIELTQSNDGTHGKVRDDALTNTQQEEFDYNKVVCTHYSCYSVFAGPIYRTHSFIRRAYFIRSLADVDCLCVSCEAKNDERKEKTTTNSTERN